MCYTQYLYHHRPIRSCHQVPRRQVHQGFGVFRPSKESCFRKTILSKIAEREEEKIICQWSFKKSNQKNKNVRFGFVRGAEGSQHVIRTLSLGERLEVGAA